MSTLADFLPVMRVILDDNDADLGYDQSDDQLKDGLRASYLLAAWPGTYELSGEAVTPEVTQNKDFAVIALESVWALTVGTTGAYSFKTRALAETDHGSRKRDLLTYVRERIYGLSNGDAVFSTRQTLAAFLQSFRPGDLMQANVVTSGSFTATLAAPEGGVFF